MTGDIYFIADLHLGHEKLITGWEDKPGIREQFKGVEHLWEIIRYNWNTVVKPQDTIYILGDIAWREKWLLRLSELNGHKRAVLGNHDRGDPALYKTFFEKVYGAKTLDDGFVLTHIPIHPSCFNRRSMRVNIHGHLHQEIVMEDYSGTVEAFPNPRYVCVSCEQVGYKPIHFDIIRERVKGLVG